MIMKKIKIPPPKTDVYLYWDFCTSYILNYVVGFRFLHISVHECREKKNQLSQCCGFFGDARMVAVSICRWNQSIQGRYDTMFLELQSIFTNRIWGTQTFYFFTIFTVLLWYMHMCVSSKMQLLSKSEHLLVIESMWLWFMTLIR